MKHAPMKNTLEKDFIDRCLYKLPPKHRRRLMRMRMRLRQSWTPLELRRTVRILRVVHDEGYHQSCPTARAMLRLGGLLFRLPWHLPCHLPPPPGEIMAFPDGAREYFKTLHTALLAERLLPLWRWRDTAARSFFRLYEGICCGDDVMVQYETEYFWYRDELSWAPDALPDPRELGELAPGDEGRRQLAVLASTADGLAEAFNWRHMHGLRRDRNHVDWLGDAPRVHEVVYKGPAWAEAVPRLPELLELHKASPEWLATGQDYRLGYSKDVICPFWKRNIFVETGALRSV
ncbi:hypothetical protein MCOR02_010269 [Pyricularia oryzae]|nr:hypothetical protein MCOR01_002543 [Pyricularia oryzae]KAH9428847.1 hypothetical protein MCOR02_010269 [Pyricularia oryzae]KAI6286522.1 hypothetical protein MCOR26_000914 [Pyricularia oryzae]KAI6317767.1 hypothetical protein MCOR29_006221 [Pyricularia oryzae]KAI6320909.1 hypothetical protein MCOR34_002831 [Pyricularia oryzae]